MEEDISPALLNVTGESSSKFKLVVNAYGCFVESDEHNEGEIFLKPVSTVKCFDSSIYHCVLILRRLRYVFSKE